MKKNYKLAHALFKAREEKKLTQTQAAELLGISLRGYQLFEHGESMPTFETLCQIAKHFGINIAEFAEEVSHD